MNSQRDPSRPIELQRLHFPSQAVMTESDLPTPSSNYDQPKNLFGSNWHQRDRSEHESMSSAQYKNANHSGRARPFGALDYHQPLSSSKENYAFDSHSQFRGMSNTIPQIEMFQQKKIVEVIKQKPVPVEKYVDVPFEKVIDVQIERVIENEIETEELVEVPVEKTIITEVPEITEVKIEKIVNVPVEKITYVDRPFEKIVEVPFEIKTERLSIVSKVVDCDERDIGNYPDATVLPTEVNIIQEDVVTEKQVFIDRDIHTEIKVQKEKMIEIPKEIIHERKITNVIAMPRPVEKIIRKDTEVHVDVPRYVDKPIIVEVPFVRENHIAKPVPIEKIVVRDVEVQVEHLIEKPKIIENLVKKEVEKVVEVFTPVEEVIDIPITTFKNSILEIEKPKAVENAKVIFTSVPKVTKKELIIEQEVDKVRFQPRPEEINFSKPHVSAKRVDKPIERKVNAERIKEVPRVINSLVEVETLTVTECPRVVERVVEKEVLIEHEIEQLVDVIVEQEVRVEREVPIYVEVVTQKIKPVFKEIIVEEIYDVEIENTECKFENEPDRIIETEDSEMHWEIQERQKELHLEKVKNESLLRSLHESYSRVQNVREKGISNEQKRYFTLFSRVHELQSKIKNAEIENTLLVNKSKTKIVLQDDIIEKNSKFESLYSTLYAKLDENEKLHAELQSKANVMRGIVLTSQAMQGDVKLTGR